MAALLEIKNIEKYFAGTNGLLSSIINSKNSHKHRIKAVDNVSFNIMESEIFGLIGESGSGKTTLARTLMRLTEPDNGEAIFQGQDVFKMAALEVREKIRSKIRMIFQHPDAALNPAFTVKMVLDQAIKVHTDKNPEEREKYIKNLLSYVGLSPEIYLHRKSFQLSGGEKRRVSICRAIATNPVLIFADEPISGLDVAWQYQILSIFKKLKEEQNLSIVFISHDIGMIHNICDRVAVMYAGKIVEIGPNSKISPDNCLHPYTQILYKSQYLSNAERKKNRQPENSKQVNDQQKDNRLSQKLAYNNSENFSENGNEQGCIYRSFCSKWKGLNNKDDNESRKKSEKCAKIIPSLKQIEGNHFVACHLAETIESERGKLK